MKILKYIEYIKKEVPRKEKEYEKVEHFPEQVKQGSYYIFTICHRSLYQRSVKLFKHEKYYILTAELYHPKKSFDEKLYICETLLSH